MAESRNPLVRNAPSCTVFGKDNPPFRTCRDSTISEENPVGKALERLQRTYFAQRTTSALITWLDIESAQQLLRNAAKPAALPSLDHRHF